jgi:NAD(P)-dependent dehydrogenase (short-subunit alcohol dehydrogenase family)
VTAHYFLSVALLKLLAAASDLDLPGGLKGRDQGRGVMVMTSSCASMHNCTNIDLTSYASSKAAIDHLVALLASKFARWYVRVNGVREKNHGGFLTDMLMRNDRSIQAVSKATLDERKAAEIVKLCRVG